MTRPGADSSAQIHPSAVVDHPVHIGARTRIWHFVHVMTGATIGADCVLGQGCFVASTAKIGNRVRVQNGVSVYDGVEIGDDVFCGPNVVFTNVRNPRAHVWRKAEYRTTRILAGATLGANATVLPGVTVGEHAFVGAGAVVTRDVPAFALVVGSPAKALGHVSRHGERLHFDAAGRARCPVTGEEYRRDSAGIVRLLDEGRTR